MAKRSCPARNDEITIPEPSIDFNRWFLNQNSPAKGEFCILRMDSSFSKFYLFPSELNLPNPDEFVLVWGLP